MQTPKTFSLEIENIAKDMKMSHMDAVLYYCEKNDLEAVNKILLTDDQTVTIEQIINWLSKKYNKKARIIKFNKYLISIMKIIYPIYSLFNKLNSNLIYKKSELNQKLHISMSSKILKDLNEI